MSDETTPLASGEPVDPAIEQASTPHESAEPATAIEDDEVIGADPDTEGSSEEVDEDDDLDFGFKKYRVPKSLKEGVEKLRKEFTQATQTASSKAKELAEREARIGEQFKASEEELSARAKLQHVNSELDKFKDWGWAQHQQLSQTDPIKADELWKYKQHLASEKSGLEQSLSAAFQRRTHEAQQAIAKRIEQTREYARKLPGYKEGETDRQVIEFAKSKGFSDNDLRNAMSPKVFEMFHLARLGEIALKKPAAKPAAPSEPLTTVGARGNPPARKSLADMSMEEYAAYRNKQLKR